MEDQSYLQCAYKAIFESMNKDFDGSVLEVLEGPWVYKLTSSAVPEERIVKLN